VQRQWARIKSEVIAARLRLRRLSLKMMRRKARSNSRILPLRSRLRPIGPSTRIDRGVPDLQRSRLSTTSHPAQQRLEDRSVLESIRWECDRAAGMLCPMAGNLSHSWLVENEPYERGSAVETYRLLLGLSLAALCWYLSAGMNDSDNWHTCHIALLKEERP
jgi:hypothetical protein